MIDDREALVFMLWVISLFGFMKTNSIYGVAAVVMSMFLAVFLILNNITIYWTIGG